MVLVLSDEPVMSSAARGVGVERHALESSWLTRGLRFSSISRTAPQIARASAARVAMIKHALYLFSNSDGSFNLVCSERYNNVRKP